MDQSWRAEARCQDMGPEPFFPRGELTTMDKEQTEAALALCAECPVVDPCLDYAMRTRQEYGVWGGTSEKDRRMWRKTGKLRRRQLGLAVG